MRDWMLDELDHAGPEHLDPAFVNGFDLKQGHPDPAEDIALFHEHGLTDSSVVVDMGAGTGQFAVPAARHFGRVVAVEVSDAMRRTLRARATAESLPNLEPVSAGFLSYEHNGAPADAVFTRHALHQLPDFWKALALSRAAEMLRPGGVLRLRDLIYDFGPDEADAVISGWLANAPQDPALGYTRHDLAEHIRTEHSTFRWLLEPMLDAAGFDIVDTDFPVPFIGAYTCVRR